jgi:phosphatidate cytidylyltransferase
VEGQYARAKRILTENKDKLTALATQLTREGSDLQRGPGEDLRRPFQRDPEPTSGNGLHSALAAGILLPGWHMVHSFGIGMILVLASITWLLLKGDEAPAHSFGGVLTLLLLVAIPFGLLPAFFGFGRWVFAAFMVLLWTNDTGAYLVGRTIGRTKLLPAVSPKKTVEGLIGGVVLTIGVGWFIAGQQPMLSRTEWIVLAAIVSITATLGDLLESAFKRARRVKDSGTVMPGHGGILDRFDGFFLAVPSVMLYLYLIR